MFHLLKGASGRSIGSDARLRCDISMMAQRVLVNMYVLEWRKSYPGEMQVNDEFDIPGGNGLGCFLN